MIHEVKIIGMIKTGTSLLHVIDDRLLPWHLLNSYLARICNDSPGKQFHSLAALMSTAICHLVYVPSPHKPCMSIMKYPFPDAFSSYGLQLFKIETPRNCTKSDTQGKIFA